MCSVVSQWTNCFIKPMFQICVCACVFMGQTCQGMETTHFKPFKHSILKEVSPGNIHWKDWCWRWNSNTLATWCEELTHWKRRWCWERLRARGEGDDRGWDGWMASPTRWTWVWASSGSWWWTGRPGVLWFMGSQRVGHNWATELNWTEHCFHFSPSICHEVMRPDAMIFVFWTLSFKPAYLLSPFMEP